MSLSTSSPNSPVSLYWVHTSVVTHTLGGPYDPTTLAPLTTYYTPSEHCYQTWTLTTLTRIQYDTTVKIISSTITTISTQATRLLTELGAHNGNHLHCNPYGISPYYSPAICPFGFSLAQITQYEVPTDTYWSGSCCPSGMSYGSDVENICYGSISTPMTLHIHSMSEGETLPGPEILWSTSTASDGQTQITWTFNTTTLATGLIVAAPIIVGWMQSDLPSFPTPYASSLAQRIGIPFTASPGSLSTLAPPTGTSSPEAAGKSNSLSGGTIAGIVIGTASAIILGMALLWFVLRRRRVAARLGDEPKAAEMEDKHAVLSMRKMFVGGKWRSEAGEEGSRHEMESGGAGGGAGVAVELDGRGVVELGVQGVRRELE